MSKRSRSGHDFAAAYNNLASVLKEQGKLDEALARYDQALALRPDYAEACTAERI